ncbi:DUF3850 domain-containing protein [Paenibacillus polysaccharolyticus]|uniref:DUF3850 domain-containing protein n=1 Tax=Paenibacillus polysaccharolyticus TaxID=582692 RepID=UPI00300AB676
MTHELKLIQPYFDAVFSGRKTFEVRKSDRPYVEGDYVHLREFNPGTGEYSGRSVLRRISYVLDEPTYVPEGCVIFGIVLPN